MGPSSDLLERAGSLLAEPAGTRWLTMRARGRTRENLLAGRVARAFRTGRDGRAQPARVLPSASSSEKEQAWRIWRDGGEVIRCEYELAQETVTVVTDGPRWWRWSDSLGSASATVTAALALSVLGPASPLADPAGLAASLELISAGQGQLAGRPVLVATGRPGATGRSARAAFRDAGPGAEEYQLSVDVERGALLGVRALRAGEAFKVTEVIEVAYDEELPAGLFMAREAAGTGRVASERSSIEDLARALGFQVLVPPVPEATAAPHVAVVRGDRSGPGPARGVVTYPVNQAGRRGQLRVQLSEREPAVLQRERWEIVGEVALCEERYGTLSRVRARVRRDGTFVELESSVLDRSRLVEMARGLEPVPPRPR